MDVVPKPTCAKCNLILPRQVTMESHLSTCIGRPTLTAKQSLSFSDAWKVRNTEVINENMGKDDSEKILPVSQPLVFTQHTEAVLESTTVEEKGTGNLPNPNQNICSICKREFSTPRGLNQHFKCCQKRNNPTSMASLDPMIDSTSQESQPETAATEISTVTDGTSARLIANVWGNHSSEDIFQVGNAIYEEIVKWRKNVFKLPSGAAGKRYIKETTRLIEIWNHDKKPLADISLKLLMSMPALLLQKPSRKSTAKQHSQYLDKRLDLWNAGNFEELMKECRAIQKRLRDSTPKNKTPEYLAKEFARFMLLGKVNAALKLLNKNTDFGVAAISEKTMDDLRKLHPEAKAADESILLTGDVPFFDPVIFNNIDESSISKAALNTRGAAGPSGMDADGWKRILVSKNYGNVGKDLRTAIANMTQTLCTRNIEVLPGTTRSNIEAYTSCRLIPLNKDADGGIRPIGIGEVLRRIIGKAILGEIKADIIESAGCLQLCAGQKAGCEAAAHSMGEIFKEEATDAVLFIDASNAFNSINRRAMLHNIRYLCPPMSTYINNCYSTSSRLFVGGEELSSDEGSTQGDPMAMQAYGIGILPFLAIINPTNEESMKQLAYADDLGGGSKLTILRRWWNRVVENGPKFGYFPKPSKSWLVVKTDKLQEAK